jgi:hypothetical protein
MTQAPQKGIDYVTVCKIERTTSHYWDLG